VEKCGEKLRRGEGSTFSFSFLKDDDNFPDLAPLATEEKRGAQYVL
jgi:hypothetical protein